MAGKTGRFYYMDDDEFLFEVAKATNLSYSDYCSLVDDMNNLQGAEWIDFYEDDMVDSMMKKEFYERYLKNLEKD